ncbi:MAG: hypothetical protein M3Y17_00855 [Actinomycetota bacterium]|nr:hypothetical protein [Actinomycetota bacterium]
MIEPHLPSVRRGQLDGGNCHPGEMVGGAVVNGRREPLRQRQRIVRSSLQINTHRLYKRGILSRSPIGLRDGLGAAGDC